MNTLTTYRHQNGATIRAESFRPSAGAARGAVVLAHGADGLIDNQNGPWATMLREHADALATAGLAVLIPLYFEATQTAPGPTAVWALEKHRQDWESALRTAVDAAGALPGVPPGKVGLLGFSLGGHLCLRLRASVPAVVACFAPLFPHLGGLGSGGGSGLAAQIHHGEADALVPLEPDGREIHRQLLASGARSTLYTYPGAGHGFGTQNASDVAARKESMQRIVTFFAAEL